MKEKMTVNDWFYNENCRFDERPVTQTSIRARDSAFRNHVKPQIGEKLLEEVEKTDVLLILESMKKEGYSLGMLSSVYSVLTLIFRSAQRNGMIADYPCTDAHKKIFADF